MQFIDKFVLLRLKFWIHPFYMYLYLLNIVLSIFLGKGSEYFFQHFILHIHRTAVTLMLSTLNIDKRSILPLTLSSLSPQLPEPVASWGSPSIKATAQHAKPLILAHCRTNPQLLYVWVSKHCDGAPPPNPPLNILIQTRTYEPYRFTSGPSLFPYYSREKVGIHRTHQELFSANRHLSAAPAL